MTKKRKGWIIQWDWFGDNKKVDPNIFHVLNPRLSPDKVIFYMRSLFINSPLFFVSERLSLLKSSPDPRVGIVNEVTRILVGDNPVLVAHYVEDLRAEYDAKTHTEKSSWTQGPGYSRKTGKKLQGRTIKKEWTIKYP